MITFKTNKDYYFALESIIDSAKGMKVMSLTSMLIFVLIATYYGFVLYQPIALFSVGVSFVMIVGMFVLSVKSMSVCPPTCTSVLEYPEFQIEKYYQSLSWLQQQSIIIGMIISFVVALLMGGASTLIDGTIESYLLPMLLIPIVLTLRGTIFTATVLLASAIQIAFLFKFQPNPLVLTNNTIVICATTGFAVTISFFLHKKKVEKFDTEYVAYRQRQELTQSMTIIETQRVAMEESNQYLIETNQAVAIKNQQLRELNDRLAVSNNELSELNRQQERIMNIVAHDLKSPLTGIQLGIEVLKIYSRKSANTDTPLTDQEQKQEKILEQSAGAIQRMQKIIGLLLEHKESKERLSNLQMQSASVLPYLQETLAEYEPRAMQKQQRMVYPSECQKNAWFDEFLFRQVLDNIISNAVKYSYPDTTITITLIEEEQCLALSVADQGQGIPLEEMGQLFQPFRKLSSRPTAGEDSTGLGLSIAKEYMEAMGGSIHAEHNPAGHGMIFTLRLKKV